MARQDIDIGVEGNDGTGDSIRESFRKTNENFEELYAVFGEGGTIDFTSLGDTPESLIPNALPVVNAEGSFINLLELASDNELDPNVDDTIVFDYSVDGKLVITTAFTQLADDERPLLGGPLNVGNNAVANVAINNNAVEDYNIRHNASINIDDLVITKGYADRRYITSGLPVRVADEPATTDQYNLNINRYVDGNVEVVDHGFDRTINGQAFTFDSRYNDPNGLDSVVQAQNVVTGRSYSIVETTGTDWTDFGAERNELGLIFTANRDGAPQDGATEVKPVYFLRFVNDDQLSVFLQEADAEDPSDTTAQQNREFLSGTIPNDEVHTLTDAGFDPNLEGNYLANAAVPRKGLVRRQGDTMTGALTLHDHPGELAGFGTVNGEDDLQAASKLYVDTTTYSSPENLFVSRSGDDSMEGVPPGREGTALDYAYRTVNAAAKRAEEIIETSLPEPGPYFQTITIDNNAAPSTVIEEGVINPSFTQTVQFIRENREYIQQEVVGYINFTYPNFVYDQEPCARDIGLILDAIASDVNRTDLDAGFNANNLTRQAAERYYSNASSLAAITTQKTQTLDGINFANLLLQSIFQNELFKQKDITDINVDTSTTVPRARVTTSSPHGYIDGEQVIFQNIGGMTEIENQTAYVRVISDDVIELYEERELANFFDISESNGYTPFTTGGIVGVVYQDREDYINSVRLKPEFQPTPADNTGIGLVNSRFNTVETIINDGIDAGADIAFGRNYKIVIDNGSSSQAFVDQGNPNNLDLLPGKVVVGDRSGAQGRIVRYIANDPLENNNDTLELIPQNAVDFIEGETMTFGNFVKNKQVTIFVESGIYEEDFPIRLSNNVSLKGDEFRRVIIRPKKRTSQSKWATTYFYKELEFDDIPLIEKRHSTVFSLGQSAPQAVEVDDSSWMAVGQAVKFAGATLIGSEVERENTYFITGIVENSGRDTITLSDTEGGSDISWTAAEGNMFIVAAEVGYFLNQTNEIQGYFGKWYLENPHADKDVGSIPNNPGGYSIATTILENNKRFLEEEIINYINTGISTGEPAVFDGFSYDPELFRTRIRNVIDSFVRDLTIGGAEFALEQQGKFYLEVAEGDRGAVEEAFTQLGSIVSQLFQGLTPTQNGAIVPDDSLGEAESAAVGFFSDLLDIILYAFNTSYNPPKQNDADQVDVFQMSDATIVRNVTVQGHGGFMVVLDPAGQILTKSPYIQTGSSFSKSDNEKRFRGGMYVDAFVGNIPVRITNKQSNFILDVESELNQGLFIRPPELPCPFFYEGIRYQVNAISNYDSGNGTATIFLDASSNPDPATGIGQGFTDTAPQEIFLQTAGNRSMLGNDFTQINDLGYGLVTNNGAVSEMVSMFTYYCQAAYYAKNGSEIRSLNGSNGYGFFGLVAEGSDPNEIPDQVTLDTPLVQPAKVYTTATETNSTGDQTIHLTDLKFVPTAQCIIRVDHGGSIGRLNYRISNIRSLSDTDRDGQIGEDPTDITATGTLRSNAVYACNITPDPNIQGDFFESIQQDIPDGTLVEFRTGPNLTFDGIRNQDALQTRPSTAINFDESDATTYRTLAFSPVNSVGVDLDATEILATSEVDYEYIELETDPTNLSGGFGDSQGDTKIAVSPINDANLQSRLTRDIAGRQPSDNDYSGGMIFVWKGKTHKVVEYNDTAESFPYVVIEDVADTNIDSGSTSVTGLNEAIPNTEEIILYTGLAENSTAEITISISLLRATGHDFTQIGAGGYNDANYPNVIFGLATNSLAIDYTDAVTATSSQVWERRKGRVFYVSTDQDGFFRVGKFFSVDQGTGDVTFSGSIGITGANALGFTRGVTINEFSADDSFSDQSGQAVPTERAIFNYINRVLGYNVDNFTQIPGAPAGIRLGPGFLPLNGGASMEADMDMGANNITNLAPPGSDNSAAANKLYVDNVSRTFDDIPSLRDTEINSIAQNDLLVATGNKKIFIDDGLGVTVGDTIGIVGNTVNGVVVDVQNLNDSILGDIDEITYTPQTGEFNQGETIYRNQDESVGREIIEEPVFEWANAREKTDSVINVTVERSQSETTYDLQIQNDSIINADVNSDAQIAQSKLNMQAANTFDEDSGTTGWNGTDPKTQSDLGLAKFSDENFETTEGFVRIKDDGIVFAEIPDLDQFQVYGRTAAGVGDPTAIDFSTVVDDGKGLEDRDFINTVIDSDTGAPGEVLVRLQDDNGSGDAVYGVTEISVSASANTVVKRDNNGKIDATALQIGGDDIINVLSNTVSFNTPAGAEIFSAAGSTDASLVTKFPGNIDVGDTGITTQSTFQNRSALSNEGWVATDWVYTSFIEAASERGSASTGIGLGDNVGFAEDGPSKIILVTGGTPRIVLSDTDTEIDNNLSTTGNLSVNGNTTLGTDGNDSIIINADLASNILPDQTNTRNIGSNSRRFNTMYANVFNGVATEAKYADLAENYTADDVYEEGTVLVFGGEKEVTVTKSKADRRVAGVVSTNPAYLMNSELDEGNATPIALQGRVPCKVLGTVSKGDLLVTSAIPGYAVVCNNPSIGTVIGKSLEDKNSDGKGVIEVVVGRT